MSVNALLFLSRLFSPVYLAIYLLVCLGKVDNQWSLYAMYILAFCCDFD